MKWPWQKENKKEKDQYTTGYSDFKKNNTFPINNKLYTPEELALRVEELEKRISGKDQRIKLQSEIMIAQMNQISELREELEANRTKVRIQKVIDKQELTQLVNTYLNTDLTGKLNNTSKQKLRVMAENYIFDLFEALKLEGEDDDTSC